MQVFCLELVSTGFFADRIPASLSEEGNAMLRAVVDDFHRIPGVTVSTILSADQRRSPLPAGCEIAWFSPSDSLEPLVGELADQAAVALIIAPEFDELLERFCLAAASRQAISLNCDPATLRLCADKAMLARHLTASHIPTIPTDRLSLAEVPPKFPSVVKPRYGAGSWLVRLVRQPTDWPAIADEYRQAGLEELLVQPWIPGRSLSCAALRPSSGRAEIFPVAEQTLSSNGTFQYQGGIVPAHIESDASRRVQQLTEQALATLPGWSGYVGLDILVPEDHRQSPLIVEINPRLTTSYLGYRRLCRENLMERLLFPARFPQAAAWQSRSLSFIPHYPPS